MFRRVGVLVVFCVFLVGLAGMTMYMLSRAEDSVKDYQAPLWAGELLVEHLQANEDRWPASWDELRVTSDALVARGWTGQLYPFDDLRARVTVEFAISSRDIAASAGAPRLILPAKDPDVEYDGDDPNIRVHEYLRKKFDPTRRPTADATDYSS